MRKKRPGNEATVYFMEKVPNRHERPTVKNPDLLKMPKEPIPIEAHYTCFASELLPDAESDSESDFDSTGGINDESLEYAVALHGMDLRLGIPVACADESGGTATSITSTCP